MTQVQSLLAQDYELYKFQATKKLSLFSPHV